jgi:hypothetical protein
MNKFPYHAYYYSTILPHTFFHHSKYTNLCPKFYYLPILQYIDCHLPICTILAHVFCPFDNILHIMNYRSKFLNHIHVVYHLSNLPRNRIRLFSDICPCRLLYHAPTLLYRCLHLNDEILRALMPKKLILN